MKIVTVVGARPQFVKAAAVSRAIAEHNAAQGKQINEVIVHTGQHFDENMSDVFFAEMEIPQPHYFLDVHSLGHGAMTGRMLEKIEAVLLAEKPDYLLVYGDTNSTLAGALAAKKLHIQVVHVEAGLRSFNMNMPEEVNRILTDRISDILCCPTETALENLRREGFDAFPCRVVKTGDVMQDAALYYAQMAAGKSDIIERLGLAGAPFAICTVHRAENTDYPGRLSSIVAALNEISREMRVVLPLHPRTRKIVATQGLALSCDVIDPVGYFDMIQLLQYCRIVLTDSGGLQKEAFFFKKPCVTLRDETEWTELVEAGVNVLAGAEHGRLVESWRNVATGPLAFDRDLYGNGGASANIVKLLETKWK